MTTLQRIEEILKQTFSPEFLEVIDESEKHIGHKGAKPGVQTHFLVRIKSEFLLNQTKVNAHRSVYEALGELIGKPIHALSIDLCR
jgi:BolA protein